MEDDVRKADDPDLDALLDSALEDFDKPSVPIVAAASATPKVAAPAFDPKALKSSSSKQSRSPFPYSEMLSASAASAGIDDEDDKKLDETLNMLMADDPFMRQQFGKFVEAASKSDGSDPASQQELAAALAETLGSLARNAESLKADAGGDDVEDMMKALTDNLQFDSTDDMPGEIMPMMQSMMKNILSKEVLYPSLKDMADKYPVWLAKNKEKISKKSYDAYARQFDIVMKLIEQFVAEGQADTETVKSQRFETILNLMTQMQDCGAPPKDIVGEMAPGLEFDDQGVPKLPGIGQCPVM